MGHRWFSVIALLCLAACAPGPPAPGSPGSAGVAQANDVDPAEIRRLRPDFPAGYEVATAGPPLSPATTWGLGQDWSADPPQCAALADPAVQQSVHGLSGSGQGCIIYAVAATSASPAGPDPRVVADCANWSLTSGTTVVTVERTDPPPIAGVTTIAMEATRRTVVEGGTETVADLRTVTAYVGEHVVFVTVITDPGSPNPQLPRDYAADLLTDAVAALRD